MRWLRMGFKVTALTVLALLAVLALVIAGAQTAPGQRWVVATVNRLMSGEARIDGLSGAIPWDMRIARVELEDPAGTWGHVENAVFRAKPAALLRGRLTIALLGAQRIRIDRAPEASTSERSSSERWGLPIGIELQRLDVSSIELAPSVLGAPANLSLWGSAQVHGDTASTQFTIERNDGLPGHLDASFALTGEPARLKVAVDIEEPSGTLLNALLSRDDSLPLALKVHGEGPLANWHGRIEAQAGDAGRLTTEVALSQRSERRIAVDGEVSAAGLLPPALGPLIGDHASFRIAGAEGADGSIRADDVALRLAAASIVGSGSVGASPQGVVSANFRITADDLGKLSALLGRPAAGSATLVLAAGGTRAKPSLTATVDGEGLRLANESADRVRARIVAGASAPLGDPDMRIAFTGDGVVAGIGTAGPAAAQQEIAWRIAGSSTADGRALEIKELAVDGPGVTLTASGRADPQEKTGSADVHLAASDLSRIDTLAGHKLAGAGALDVMLSREESGGIKVKLDGRIHDLATGVPMADALLGGRLAIDIAGGRAATGELAVEAGAIEAANLRLTGKGSMDPAANRTEGSFALELPRLDVLSTEGRAVAGRAHLEGTFSGSADAPKLEATLEGDNVRSGEMRLDRLTARLHATKDRAIAAAFDADFTSSRVAGRLEGRAALSADGKNLDLSTLKFAAGGTTLDATLRSALDTHLTSGTIRVRSPDLSRLSTLVGMPLSGTLELDARLASERGQSADFSLSAAKLELGSGLGGVKVERLAASGRFSDLFGKMGGNANLAISGATLGSGSLQELHASVKSARASTLSFAADMRGVFKAPIELATAGDATIGADHIAARISKFAGTLSGQTLRLDQALSIAKSGKDVSISGLKLAVGTGQLSGAGSLKQDTLFVKLAARDVPLALAEAFAGKGAVGGLLDVDVDVYGALDRPSGRIAMAARGLRLAMAASPGVPSLDLTAEVRLEPKRLLLEGRVADAKGEAIDLSGTLPIRLTQHPFSATMPRDGALTLSVKGDGQLENLAELLPIGEDRLSGHYHLDLRATGTVATPNASGEVTLSQGRYESLVYGTVLNAISLDLAGDRDKIVLRDFSATDSGKGTLKVGGTVVLAAKPEPSIEATVALRDFQLVHRDDAIAHGSGDIDISGTMAEPRVVARLKVDDAQLYLAERLPSSVRRLDVTEIDSRTGEVLKRAQPPSSEPPIVAPLDIKVDLPGQIFIRGRGLDSEWQGRVDVGGTSAAPDIEGKLEVVHGTMNFLGKTLDLTRGTVVLAGGNKIAPLLDFLAESTGAQIKAEVAVTGPVDNPTIKITSDPPMPQDEVLAQLLFGRDVTQLTPMEGLEIAQAAAALASGGPGVMDRLRMKFGLDRLSVGSSDQRPSSGSSAPPPSSGAAGAVGNTTLSAGKYIAPGVLVGIDQGVSGESRAKVEVEITRHVTVNTTTSTNRGDSLGVNWKFDY